MSTRDGKKKPKKHRPWRETIEGLTVAIVMAVFLKYFIVEAYRIPSGSMQPTLMGNPETGIFDRILVDKLSYHFRDPERFEVVVFRHPLNRSLNMIKRIVGMPDESLRIRNGDLWTRADDSESWQVLRRPERVQRAMWRRLDTHGRWKLDASAEGWSLLEDGVRAEGDGAIAYPGPNVSVRNGYVDGYPGKLADQIRRRTQASGRYDVADLRLEGAVVPEPGCRAIAVELREGRRSYLFRVPGPAAPEDDVPTIAVEGLDDVEGARGEPLRLEAGARVTFAVQNLDDELRLEVDGEVLLRVEVDSSTQQQSQVTLLVEGQGADLTDLEVFRDVYYLGPEANMRQTVFDIGPDEYVMLGDNTLDSADTRAWKQVVIEAPDGDGGRVQMRGNSRPSQGIGASFPNDTNPWIANGSFFFCDEWGETFVFDEDEVDWREPDEPGPKVSRRLITGRALAVFWPISIRWRTVRLQWIR